MRLWSWCAVAAVLAVAGAGTIRRTPVDSSRVARKFTSPDFQDNEGLEKTQPNPLSDSVRPRSFTRRRDGPPEHGITRTRTRARPSNTHNDENLQPPSFSQRKTVRNEPAKSFVDISNPEENLNPRSRYSRTRKKPDPVPETVATSARAHLDTLTRSPIVRSRTRQNARVTPTPASIEATSPVLDETKLEVISLSFDEITQSALRDEALQSTKTTDRTPSRSRQRSRVTPKETSTEQNEKEITTTKRNRGRNITNKTITPKPDTVDTISSESINEVTVVFKEPTTARTVSDFRNSRKLRYKSKLSETDTNLTGEGDAKGNEEIKSSQLNETTPSQTDKSLPSTRVTIRSKPSRKPYQPPSGSDTNSEVKIVTRRKLGLKPSVSTKKSKTDVEIGEDENYPESFKALLQAKNASPQAEPSNSESLSVKASEKVYHTFPSSSTDAKSINAQRYTRFRPENSVEASKRIDSIEEQETIKSNNQTITVKAVRKTEHKTRSPYLARYRKSSSFAPTRTSTEPTKIVIDKQKYNFNRPIKITTTTPPADTLISRQNKTISVERIKSLAKNPVLRSTYYTRFRPAVQKTETVSETDFNNKTSTTNAPRVEDEINEVKFEEINELPQALSLTTKYHSSYKDRSSTPEAAIRHNYTPVPIIQNIHSRNSLTNARTLKPQTISHFEEFEELSSKKYSESYSKTTLPATNVIPGFEIRKSRFSSKYRAPLDKPTYLPTVPSVAPPSAWMKFFVTDSHLTDTLSEPTWFIEEEANAIGSIDTSQASRGQTQNFTQRNPDIDSSTAPEMGEDNEIGPEVNVISFSKAQSTPSSADLRLSETKLMPSNLINVETSLHSPSVTISIFDALAEILTSTPKISLSSTTEAKQITNNTTIPNLTLDVSNQTLNFNVLQDSSSQIMLATTIGDVTETTKPVQTTMVTSTISSISTDAINTVTTLPTTSPSPIPTSPLPLTSRKPFATVILYSTTEQPTTDAITPASQTSNRPSTTESSSMVFNTVSDLILSSNNIISSQLNSMLSNNINDILLNMDEDTRAKVSVNMNAFLRSLSVRALDDAPLVHKLEDLTLNTTPFSEEDILATQLNETVVEIPPENSPNRSNMEKMHVIVSGVNNMASLDTMLSSTEGLVTQNFTILSNASIVLSDSNDQGGRALSMNPVVEPSSTNSPAPSDVNTNNSELVPPVPIPFISNLQVDDDLSEELTGDEITSSIIQPTRTAVTETTTPSSIFAPLTLRPIMENYNSQDPCLLTPAQFWGLSKKARVLKIIEDIIRQHNIELTTTPRPMLYASDVTMSLIRDNNFERLPSSTEKNLTPNPFVSSVTNNLGTADIGTDLGEIVLNGSTSDSITSTTTTMTTEMVDITTQISSADTFSTPIASKIVSVSSVELSSTDLSSRFNEQFDSTDASLTEKVPTEVTSLLNEPFTSSSELSTLLTSTITSNENPSTYSDIIDFAMPTIPAIAKTTESSLLVSPETTLSDLIVTTSALSTTKEFVTTTMTEDAETSLPTTTIDTTTTEALITETPIKADLKPETITTTDSVITKMNIVITSTSSLPVATSITTNVDNTPPKKDYVIFGILPNNTVVRKNPNEDPLESLTESSPYIIYGVLPNNTIIRRFPNGTRVPRVMQRIDVLPISPWSLRNPYSPIHNNPAIVKPSNPIRDSTNVLTPSTDTSSNGMEITDNTVNNTQLMITSQALGVSGKGSLATIDLMSGRNPDPSTPSHVLSLRTRTMLPSVNEILLNSISSATKEEQVANVIEMTSSTREPRILTLDIDPETKLIRTEKPDDGMGNAVFKFIPIDEVQVSNKVSNVFKFASTKPPVIATTEMDVSTTEYTQVDETTQTINQITTLEVPTTERVTTTSTTTTETIPTVPIVLSTTFAPTSSTLGITTTKPITTTFPMTTETEQMSTTFLPTMFAPRRVAFRSTTEATFFATDSPTVMTTTQRKQEPDTQAIDEIGISTTNIPVFTSRMRPSITTRRPAEKKTIGPRNQLTTTDAPFAWRVPGGAFGMSTTDVPSTSTFSVEEDIAFLQNLKSVVSTNADDPETSLANRIIALAVERSLNDLSTNKDSTRSGKKLNYFDLMDNRNTLTTTTTTSTTTTTTTTTPRPTTTRRTTTSKSIEEEIRQFQEDTKLLQALLKATGQNPATFKIPSIPTTKTNVRTSLNKIPTTVDDDLKLLSNLLSSPSPLNEPFEPLTPKPNIISFQDNKAETSISLNVKPLNRPGSTTTNVRNDNTIPSIKDDLKSFQDDTKLLQTLLQLQGGKPSTTQQSKIPVTGLTGDETLATLLAQSNKKVVAATKAPMTLSTEYGKTNDALLAALLKEQGFGPTTANSLEEQIKLAAILNQVIVTPKPRRVTKPPPPPPPPPPAPARRPVIDGLAWLWQQWRDTSPGPTRGARRPSNAPAAAPAAPAAVAAASAPSRVNWFGSGPFVGNADEAPPAPSTTSNREFTQKSHNTNKSNTITRVKAENTATDKIPLEPPRAVSEEGEESPPGRGQLVSAAINVTRAFSQFLGAAIQGAAKTVQNVIKAGQKAATDVYASGSG